MERSRAKIASPTVLRCFIQNRSRWRTTSEPSRTRSALLLVLDQTRFSRILGLTSEIILIAKDYGGSKWVLVDLDW